MLEQISLLIDFNGTHPVKPSQWNETETEGVFKGVFDHLVILSRSLENWSCRWLAVVCISHTKRAPRLKRDPLGKGHINLFGIHELQICRALGICWGMSPSSLLLCTKLFFSLLLTRHVCWWTVKLVLRKRENGDKELFPPLSSVQTHWQFVFSFSSILTFRNASNPTSEVIRNTFSNKLFCRILRSINKRF